MDPTDGLFEQELHDLSYTPLCIYGQWKRVSSAEKKEAPLSWHRERSRQNLGWRVHCLSGLKILSRPPLPSIIAFSPLAIQPPILISIFCSSQSHPLVTSFMSLKPASQWLASSLFPSQLATSLLSSQLASRLLAPN